MVSMMDANLGRILDELDRLGETDNTLVIFTADHGDMQGGHGMYDKTSYSMYEETTRVPLLLRYPGRIPAGKTVHTQAGTCDISPTILDYLGLKIPGTLSGRSLKPFIEGSEDLDRPMFAGRDRSAWGSQDPPHFQRLIRTQDWKYSYHSRGDSQLYNLSKDPGETRNLIDEPAARSAKLQLHAALVEWMNDTSDPRAGNLGDV
jgi:arylsulfatase A-like enzyme